MAGRSLIAERKTKKEEIQVENQYVTFVLRGQKFGVEVMKSQEVIFLAEITSVPNAKKFMKGVIDLRGKIIPLIDLGVKFKMNEIDYSKKTVVIIVEMVNTQVGMIVDSVSDVISIASPDIQNTPHFSEEINDEYIEGIVKIDEEILIILNVDQILTDEEIELIAKNEIAS